MALDKRIKKLRHSNSNFKNKDSPGYNPTYKDNNILKYKWCKVTDEGPTKVNFDTDDNRQIILQEISNKSTTAHIEVELPAITAQIDHRGFRDSDLLQIDE